MSERGEAVLPPPGTEAMRAIVEPARLVTLMALASFGSGEQVTIADIAGRADEMQGPDPPRFYTKSIVSRHCRIWLENAGLVTLEDRPNGKANAPATHVELTNSGRTDGLAFAGAHLDLQLAVPQDTFLEDVMGTKTDPERNPRPLLYEPLLRGSRSIGEIVALTGLGQTMVSRHVAALVKKGVLDYDNLLDPDNQTYNILADPADFMTRGAPGNLLARVVKVYYDTGLDGITGEDIVQRTAKLYPEIAIQELWPVLKKLAREPKRARFISPESAQQKPRSIVRINEEYRPYIERLFEMWQVIFEKSPEAEDFRDRAKKRALEIANRQSLLRQTLLAHIGSTAIKTQTETIPDGERKPLSMLPLRPIHTEKPLPVILHRGTGELPLTANSVEPFRPFSDQDKVMQLAPASDGGVEVALIEACGASLEVNDTRVLRSLHGERVVLNSREKFALLLLTLGAEIADLDAYCLDRKETLALFEKMRLLPPVGLRHKTVYARVAYVACQALLEPITPPNWHRLESFDSTKLKSYLNGTMTNGAAHIFREQAAVEMSAYAMEKRQAWNSLNLKLLLAHAENRLPPNLM